MKVEQNITDIFSFSVTRCTYSQDELLKLMNFIFRSLLGKAVPGCIADYRIFSIK